MFNPGLAALVWQVSGVYRRGPYRIPTNRRKAGSAALPVWKHGQGVGGALRSGNIMPAWERGGRVNSICRILPDPFHRTGYAA